MLSDSPTKRAATLAVTTFGNSAIAKSFRSKPGRCIVVTVICSEGFGKKETDRNAELVDRIRNASRPDGKCRSDFLSATRTSSYWG